MAFDFFEVNTTSTIKVWRQRDKIERKTKNKNNRKMNQWSIVGMNVIEEEPLVAGPIKVFTWA